MDDETVFETGVFKINFPFLVKPNPNFTDRVTYCLTMLLPKTDVVTVGKLKRASEVAIEATWGTKKPAKIKTFMKDGDGPEYEENSYREQYIGHYIINSYSSSPIRVVDRNLKDITSIDAINKIKSGDECKALVRVAAYSRDLSKGVSVYVNALQFVKFGDRSGSPNNAPIEQLMKRVEDGDDLEDDFDICT